MNLEPLKIPAQLAANCAKHAERAAWLQRLPAALKTLSQRWALTLEDPFDGEEVSCSWVAPVRQANGSPAVLKLGMPHMEGEHEMHGLRYWDGDPTVRLFAWDAELGAMLMERCVPGIALRSLPEPEQDVVLCGLLRRLWRSPVPGQPFRPLSALIEHWREETMSASADWPDAGLVSAGLSLLSELSQSSATCVLLATDLHAGNVLQSTRRPWLIIDPKPFVGDPAYDVTQHLFNCDERLLADPECAIRRVADLAQVDRHRVRLWTFARAAAEPRDDWSEMRLAAIARVLAP